MNTLNLSGNKIGAYDRDGDNAAPWIPTPDGPNALFDSLKANTTLTALDFSKNHVDAAGAKGIAECIKVNRALTSLDLSNNDIGGMSGYVKKHELQGTSFKKGDTVQYNGQQCIVFKEEDGDGKLKVQNISGIVALAEALKVNRALNSVDLTYAYNSISNAGKQHLRDAVKGKNTTLQL